MEKNMGKAVYLAFEAAVRDAYEDLEVFEAQKAYWQQKALAEDTMYLTVTFRNDIPYYDGFNN